MATEIFKERADKKIIISEQITYAGLVFPRYLVTNPTFEEKMAKITAIISRSKNWLAEGTPTGDAGDTHGQYHNELAWYKEQEMSSANKRATELGKGLDEAYIVEGYDLVRQEVKKALNIHDIDRAILGARIRVAYNEDLNDIEEIQLVAPLDGGSKPGWVSVEAPLARAIEGKKAGESCYMGEKKNPTTLRILEVG